MSTKKTGALSKDAKIYIELNSSSMTPEKIAEHIGKSKETVEKYITKNNLIPYGESHDEKTIREERERLHSEEFWQGIIDNYSKTEQDIFEAKWIALVNQFQGDVQETEKLQIHKYLTLFLLRERCVKKQTIFQRTLESIQKQLEDHRRLPPLQRNADLMSKLATTIQSLTSESKNITREISDLSKQESDIEKALRGTREQRIKISDDATKNFTSILGLLEVPSRRRAVGMNIEVHRRAAIKAREDMAKPHQYLNKQVDLPLLTSETVKNLNLEEFDE